jgi:hypothetical protein
MKKCYYKPSRSEKRHFKLCDVVRVAKSARDNGTDRKAITAEVANAMGYSSVLDGEKLKPRSILAFAVGFVKDDAKVTEVFKVESFAARAVRLAVKFLLKASILIAPLVAIIIAVILETSTISRDKSTKCKEK